MLSAGTFLVKGCQRRKVSGVGTASLQQVVARRSGGVSFEGILGELCESVPISSLKLDGSPRLNGESREHVQALAELEVTLPPITVHRATGRVIDGVHRVRAAQLRGESLIKARYFDGEEVDAFVLAVRENSAHGLPLSNTDRRSAASRILGTHPHWSDRAIATSTGLSTRTVAALRNQQGNSMTQSATRLGRDGKLRPLDCAEGRRRAGELLTASPDASLRQVARATGLSPTTVRDVKDRLSRGEDPVPGAPLTQGQQRSRQPRQPSALDPLVVLRRLNSDPALRSNEMGRVLLRTLSMQVIDAQLRQRLVENIPAHCIDSIVWLASECATSWTNFAAMLTTDAPTS